MYLPSGLGGFINAGSLAIKGAGFPIENTKSISFDGIDDRLEAANTSVLDLPTPETPFSIFIWAKFNQAYGDYALIAKTRNTNEGGYILRYNGFNGDLDLEIRSQDVVHRIYVRNEIGLLNDDQWYCFCVTYDGSVSASGVKLYLDGIELTGSSIILDGLTTFDNVTSNRELTLGSYTDGLKHIDGNIDEPAVWIGHALSEAEYLEAYNTAKIYDLTRLTNPPTSWWRMGDDENDDTDPSGLVYDQVGSNNLSPLNMSSSNIVEDTF